MEAGAQHPRGGGLTPSREPVVGIDLGTTNSALAWADARGPLRIFDVPQLVAPGEVSARPTLPSFLYVPTDADRAAGLAALPWNPAPEILAGTFARDHGALLPSRQISSAKSWLSNALVDRTAPLLPWGTESGPKLSPVEASTALLAHVRDAWNHERGTTSALQNLPIVLTVPASFDEEARELTVEAARACGFEQLTLLEEPLAALYAWIAAHRHSMAATFGDGAVILVCDVGGGTTDFSLIRASVDLEDGELAFERIAIGQHLLLGGDNMDLALAVLVERKFGSGAPLTLTQRQMLRRKCSAAKERLLSDPPVEAVPITVLGAGRGVVGQGLTADLTRAEVLRALEDFLPLTAPDDLPARDRRAGLRELGLPFETEPAITKHLAAFLTRAARAGREDAMARPGAVLFNGGFFTPAVARQRIVNALASWIGTRPIVLENDRPESAVAVGAAFYARLREDPEKRRRLVIRAGSARAYYVALSADERDGTPAVCVIPRGTQEGTRFEIERAFTVVANQPAGFTLYSSTERSDAAGAVVTLRPGEDAERHAPLVTAFRYGKRSRRVPLAVRLSAAFTETGTLELWCESTSTEHRWRLAFSLRGVEADPLEAFRDAEEEPATPTVVVADDAVAGAGALVRQVFGEGAAPGPEALVGELENVLGHGKQAWPLEVIRRLADVLLDVADGRARSAAHEVRWLNLTGFCLRPGFGSASDPWRVTELRKVYLAGLAFPKDVQCQVEWLVLWQRTGAGFTAGQQRELAQRVAGQLAIGQRKPPRLNPQIERESWRLLGSLERLDAGYRAKAGDALLARMGRDGRNGAALWTIGRLGARTPLYGPLNSVVAPAVAERWIGHLLDLKQLTPDAAAAVIEIGARTGDAARDVSAELAERAAGRLRSAGIEAGLVERLTAVGPSHRADAARIFGESLPEGLRLA